MNEESSHLTAVGDEALEARIIAWVLGEASSFEAAELEKICAQAPEWRVFQRRMLAVHQLLGEATASNAAADWSLPTEKRGKLDALLGAEAAVVAPARKRNKWWGRTARIAALLILLLAIASLATPALWPKKMIREMGMQDMVVRYNRPLDSKNSKSPGARADTAQFKGGVEVVGGAAFPMTPATPTAFEGKEENVLPSLEEAEPKKQADAFFSDGDVAASDAKADPFSAPAPAESRSRDLTVAAGEGEADPFMAPEPQNSVGTTSVPGVLAARGAGASAETVTADPFAAAPASEEPSSGPVDPFSSASASDGLAHRGNSSAIAGKPAASRPSSSSSSVVQGEISSLAQNESIRRAATNSPSVDFGNSDNFGYGWGADKGASGGGGGQGGGFTTTEQKGMISSGTGALVLGDEEAQDRVSQKDNGVIMEGGQVADQAGKTSLDGQNQFQYHLEYEPPVIGDALAKGKEGEKGTKEQAADADYFRAAYDHTRAQLLTEVDEHWELEIPKPLLEKGLEELAKNKKKENAQLDDNKPQTLIELAELSAAQEAYSTFSLRVSDNSFRVAQAAMARNERPAPESVRVEEFYNAFDYGDPVPTAQEPVAAAMEQSAHPILPQRNLLRIALRTAAAGRGASQPLHLTLLVDQSGSMSRGDRSAALAASIKELSSLLSAQDQISVIGFSRTPRLLAEKVPGDQQAKLIEMLARTPSDGGTNLEEALKLGEMVAKRNHRAGAQNRLLLLTDGAANLGNADPDRLAAWVKTLRQQNIAFDIAGIGTDGLNDPLLVEIARNGNGRYYVMNDAKQAKQDFAAQLAGAFRPAAENVKVQVQFNPQRVGKYKLVGFEKDRLRTEDFRNDKVDAAEMAAAEAGQALYQVELLPEGTGDVGEVSVRFRDVATQQMVERKWTIRYDPATPAFDRASPTMQLAGLAMLTAEKLQGRDAASIIRFADLLEPQQRVRESFSSSKRVGELLEMMQQLNQ